MGKATHFRGNEPCTARYNHVIGKDPSKTGGKLASPQKRDTGWLLCPQVKSLGLLWSFWQTVTGLNWEKRGRAKGCRVTLGTKPMGSEVQPCPTFSAFINRWLMVIFLSQQRLKDTECKDVRAKSLLQGTTNSPKHPSICNMSDPT